MDDKDRIIKEILDIEWELFTNLNNVGGRANCQDNKNEFLITRSSQWENLSRNVCYSYLKDLHNARISNTNPLFEKYAYMMEYTHKDEFDKIKMYLPEEDERKNKVISKIEEIVMNWEKEFHSKYPKISKFVRQIDIDDVAPARAYLIGEHKSYSYTTNLIYLEYIKTLDFNLVEKIYSDIIAKKGLKDLDTLEGSL
ncbi:DUF4125 family protein [Oceanivirga miroungae]|uniref:DUF4125 domain-containing protein n=1 Tax=Oceanivirga miroungae TaxID=1130046 RepID=A0A6I8MFG6_9FUSO|nr:DUF4125 family protein [Oceanivirga miroungae]VWL85859.1 hypothetical protein OMES3154_01145 [Oceanivirga miroungae]